VNWSLMDYITMGGMLGGAGLPLAIAMARAPNLAYRAAVVLAVGACFLMTWISLAVGIIGEPNNVGNLMFAAVLTIALGGALIVRFRSRGMAQAMFVAAGALVVIPIVALILRLGVGSEHWPLDVIVLSGFFAALFAGSASLFQLSARALTPAR